MADAFEDEAEPTISIGEYLEVVEEQELEADLVLGGDEGKECTYNKCYVKRQAVFSCLTCTPDGNAGICTACILSCHDGHEIVELWTKRKFKCDCGNSKFGEFYCKLFPGKDAENQDNSYNHNFRGLYCTCNGQYPDPHAEEQVEMIQCCICEDWFHEEHLGLESSDEIPRDEDGEPVYEDLICQSCSNICFFLSLYPSVIKAVGGQQKAATSANENAGNEIASLPCGSSGNTDSGTYSAVVKEVIEKASAPEESSDKLETGLFAGTSSINANVVSVGKGILLDEVKAKCTASGNCNQSAEPSGTCVLGVNLLETVSTQEKCKAMFLAKNWRELLCRCENCVEFYSKKRIDFLLDKDDTIAEYEKMAKQKRNEKLEQEEGNELNMLNKLPHVAKMEFLSGVDEMKTEILSFLDSFDSSKPVTAADVHQVFENLAKKRKRVP